MITIDNKSVNDSTAGLPSYKQLLQINEQFITTLKDSVLQSVF